MFSVKRFLIIIAGAAISTLSIKTEAVYSHLGHFLTPEELEALHSESSHAEPQDFLVVTPDTDRPSFYSAGGVFKFLALSGETRGQFSLFEFTAPAGVGIPPHLHTVEAESFYVQEGRLEFQLEEETIGAIPGTFLYLPRRRPHGFANPEETAASVLTISVPGGFEEFVEETGEPVTDSSTPPPPIEDPSVLVPIAEKYGIDIVPPFKRYEGAEDYLVVTPSTDRPSFSRAGAQYTSLATLGETARQFSLYDVFLPPQAGPKVLRSNDKLAQAFYIRDGEVTFQIKNQTVAATPGTFIYLDKGTPYAFQNRGTTPARTLSLTPVPEPSTCLGIVGFGAYIGVSLLKKRNQKKQKLANSDTRVVP